MILLTSITSAEKEEFKDYEKWSLMFPQSMPKTKDKWNILKPFIPKDKSGKTAYIDKVGEKLYRKFFRKNIRRNNAIEEWLNTLDCNKNYIIGYEIRPDSDNDFVCPTGLVGKFINKHRPDIKIVLDDDRKKLDKKWLPKQCGDRELRTSKLFVETYRCNICNLTFLAGYRDGEYADDEYVNYRVKHCVKCGSYKISKVERTMIVNMKKKVKKQEVSITKEVDGSSKIVSNRHEIDTTIHKSIHHDSAPKDKTIPKKKPTIKLVGTDGNILNLVGIAAKALTKAKLHKEAKELNNKIFSCGGYDKAIALISQYCNIS